MQFRRHLVTGLIAGAVLAPVMGHADTKWYDKVTVGGYTAADYEVWLNQPVSNAGVPGRAFDGTANVFDYTGELTLNYKDSASNTSSMVDLLYGNIGKGVNAALSGTAVTIGQAFLSQGWGPLTLDLGKFATPVGYEVWSVTGNANYSRSLTYGLEPLFSLGAKLDYAGPGGFGANLWVDNGTNVDPYNAAIADNGKGIGLALSYSGIKNLALNAQFYHDNSTLIGTQHSVDYIDVNAAYTLSDSLTFAAEYLYWTNIDGTSPYDSGISNKINSAALYATYNTPMKNLSVSGRVEQLNAPDNGLNARVADSYTATVKYAMGPVTDILEYRADATNGYNFPTKNGAVADNSQVDSTVTIAATYAY